MVGKHKLTKKQVERLIAIYVKEYKIENVELFQSDILSFMEGYDLARMLIRKYSSKGLSNQQIIIKLDLPRGLVDSAMRTAEDCCTL